MEILLIGSIAALASSILNKVANQHEAAEMLNKEGVVEAVRKIGMKTVGMKNLSPGGASSKISTKDGTSMRAILGENVYLTAEEHNYLQQVDQWDEREAIEVVQFVHLVQEMREASYQY